MVSLEDGRRGNIYGVVVACGATNALVSKLIMPKIEARNIKVSILFRNFSILFSIFISSIILTLVLLII